MIATLLCVFFSASVLAAPSDRARYVELIQKGVEQLRSGKYAEALGTFQEAEKLAPRIPIAPYNIACAYSLMGKKEEALTYLKKAIELGFNDVDHIENDSDLASLRPLKAYKELVGRLRKKLENEENKLKQEGRSEMQKALKRKEPLFAFEFDLKDVDGKGLSLSKLAGKVVLVDIWGTWCPPCRREVPHLIKLQKTYGPKGLCVVGLAFEGAVGEEQRTKVKAFMKEANINYRCALIDRTLCQKVPDFRGFPTVLLVDRAGKVRFKHVGYTPHAKIAGWVEVLLAEKPAGGRPGGKKETPEKKKRRSKWF